MSRVAGLAIVVRMENRIYFKKIYLKEVIFHKKKSLNYILLPAKDCDFFMKKIILLTIILLGIGASAEAQQHIPTTILSEFNKRYKNAEDVDWEEQKGKFSAYFILNENYVTATFSKGGKWLKSTRSINKVKLPNKSISIIKNAYPKASYAEIIKIKTEKNTQFKVELITQNAIVIQYFFDKKGRVLKKTVVK